MGDYVWFVKFYNDKTVINVNNKKIIYKSKCQEVLKINNKIYLLSNGKITINDECSDMNFFVIDTSSNHIFVDEKIYVSGEDTGIISVYDLKGELSNTIKLGEHISDFTVFNNHIYAITYHDNFLIKSTSDIINKKVVLENFPQRILVKKYVYVLLNSEFYSFIKLFDYNLNLIKSICFKRQIGDLYSFKNKIIFNGDEKNYILTENLTLISQKNSTGKSLCKFSNIPIFEDNMMLDVINNIIYPL